MNKIIRQAIGIFSGLAVPVTSALAGNLLTNPGFESDPIGQTTNLLGWTAYGGNAYSETSPTLAHSGTNYFKVYQQFNGQVNYTGIYQDYISGPGAVYSANGWAYTLSGDKLAGQNIGWIEITFRDASANVLALYRSALITTNSLANGIFPVNTWVNLPVTNQYNPNTSTITNTTAQLVAPAGAYFVRYQIVLQGDANTAANGSLYFDDLNLAQTGNLPYGNWNIVWSDEFNGTNINTNVWTYDIGNGSSGWGNNELEYYTSRTNNAYVTGGLLHIVARKESTNGFSYTSARMKTQGLISWKYGRFEWRARFPAGNGFWPGLWLLGTNITTVGWPGCGEIDVMENSGAVATNVQGSLHSGSDETALYTFLNGDSVTNFHTYDLDWNTNAFLFYVDGHLYETQTSWGTSVNGATYPFPFNQPFFIIMNLAVGGNYLTTNGVPGNNPSITDINKSTFPGDMQVDYVRIYNQTSPLRISITQANSKILLAWPGNIVCHLQTQTNSLGTNWIDTVTATNSWQLIPSNNAAFYRLESP
ncbi:MAG: family 16 glycosylhydrolase [Limisphaerales bacterium]